VRFSAIRLDRGAAASIAGLALLAVALLAPATAARADEWVNSCGTQPNHVFVSPPSTFNALADCPGGQILLQSGNNNVDRGSGAIWQAVAPAGLTIEQAWVSGLQADGVNAGSFSVYGGNFYWAGGTSNIVPNETWAILQSLNSRYFGFLLVCIKLLCDNSQNSGFIATSGINLDVAETIGPSFTSPSGLWQSSGWVRGTWPFVLSADSPSGVCSLAASLDGQLIARTQSNADLSVWHQCSAAPIDIPVNTIGFGQGALQLALSADDAAAQHAATSETVYVDNQQPTLSLSGPTDAPSTAGTQYVTATASAGPSGIAGISCSLDGAPAQWYAASTAQIAVAGIGTHQVQCTAENNAVDASGVHGSSAPATYSLRIGVPTVAVVAFSKVVDKLRCHRVTERVRIPARWVKVRVRGRLERVHEKAHIQKIKVTRCHARTVRRRITRVVTVQRHGKRVRVKRSRLVRVVVEPRTVFKTTRRVRHGHGTIVDGWLGTTTGTALAGQTVDVLTAADNGRENFHVAAVTTTAANGGWSAPLPAGPSRLIDATYPGAASTEAAISAPVHLVVPAKVKLLSVFPRRVPWGGVVHLVGRLKGGYLPRGGALVRLRIGEGSAVTTYGVREHVHGDGRFTTTYHFGEGDPSAHRSFWFQIASLPMGDYPYAPAASRRLSVSVGGHPRPPHHHRPGRHH
jgi:hypothetical protein